MSHQSETEFQEYPKVCRLCLDPNSKEELIAPCGCDGPNKWVHRSCINAYRIFYNDPVAFGKCLVCGVDYTFKHVTGHSIPWLITKMVFKLIFQVFCLFIGLVLLFYVSGLIPYALEAHYFHFYVQESDDKWFVSGDFYWLCLVLGMALDFFILGLWSIAGLFKRCFCKSDFDEELTYTDTKRIGACCSLSLCCMPYIYKQSFLYRWGCCQCCECCPNTLCNCYDCDCLDCLLCCYCCDCCTDCCGDCCFIGGPVYYHGPFWHRPHYHRGPAIVCACGDCDCNCGSCSGCGDCKIGGGSGSGGSGDNAGMIILIIIAVIIAIIICVGAVVGTFAFFVFLAYIIKINFESIKKQAESEIYIIDNWDEGLHPMPVRDPPGFVAAPPPVYPQQQMPVYPPQDPYMMQGYGQQVPPPQQQQQMPVYQNDMGLVQHDEYPSVPPMGDANVDQPLLQQGNQNPYQGNLMGNQTTLPPPGSY